MRVLSSPPPYASDDAPNAEPRLSPEAREALALAQLACLALTRGQTHRAARYLGEALATLGRGEPECPAQSRAPRPPILVVGEDAAWFHRAGGSAVDLRRRGPVRRILAQLVERRFLSPGTGTTTEELFRAGWPEETVDPEVAPTRVYGAIRTLRALGLGATLLHGPDGYLLDPEQPLVLSRGG